MSYFLQNEPGDVAAELLLDYIDSRDIIVCFNPFQDQIKPIFTFKNFKNTICIFLTTVYKNWELNAYFLNCCA